jgi:2-dehydro-3-deoxyphosphogluconate aldolase/(4S)-4-hydroxy-2-oxoglutarate aldolase
MPGQRESVSARLASIRVVPLVKADDPRTAVRVSQALAAGGLTVVEIVFRTDRALECLQAVADEVPAMTAGAGTVLSARQAEQALAHGARFIVSPGLDEGVIDVARNNDVEVFPGIATATELQRAHNLGLQVVKFFPASIAGGIPAIKALASVFRAMKFMPTGGISAGNLAEYLAVPAVLACGGSWLTPDDVVGAGRFDEVTRLAEEAVAIAAGKMAGRKS